MFTEKIGVKVSIHKKEVGICDIKINQNLNLKLIRDILERIKKELTHE